MNLPSQLRAKYRAISHESNVTWNQFEHSTTDKILHKKRSDRLKLLAIINIQLSTTGTTCVQGKKKEREGTEERNSGIFRNFLRLRSQF